MDVSMFWLNVKDCPSTESEKTLPRYKLQTPRKAFCDAVSVGIRRHQPIAMQASKESASLAIHSQYQCIASQFKLNKCHCIFCTNINLLLSSYSWASDHFYIEDLI